MCVTAAIVANAPAIGVGVAGCVAALKLGQGAERRRVSPLSSYDEAPAPTPVPVRPVVERKQLPVIMKQQWAEDDY